MSFLFSSKVNVTKVKLAAPVLIHQLLASLRELEERFAVHLQLEKINASYCRQIA